MFFPLRQLYSAPEQALPPTKTSYSPITPSSFSPSHPEGQAVLPSQEWKQAGDSFKPIFRESTSSYPKASTPSYEKPEKREIPVKSVRAKPSGEKFNIQFFLLPRVRVPFCAPVLPNCSASNLVTATETCLYDGCKRGHKRRGSCRKSGEGTSQGGAQSHPPPLPETATQVATGTKSYQVCASSGVS